MSDGSAVALRDLSQSDSAERSGNLLSASRDWAELELTDGGASIPNGTMVGLQTSQTIYLGLVASAETLGASQRLRIRVDHWVALPDIAAIQAIWTQEKDKTKAD